MQHAYMHTCKQCMYLCVLYTCMSGKNLQKNQISYWIWGNCVHRNRPCAHRHNTRFCMLACNPRDYFFPIFLVESWPYSTLGNNTSFPLDSSKSVKEKSNWKAPAYRRLFNATSIYVFGITSVTRRLIYWKYFVLIHVSESSKLSVSYSLEFLRKASHSPSKCLCCAWMSRGSWMWLE